MPRSWTKRPEEEQIAVDLRIAGADPQDDFHEVDDVLQQAALVGVMVLHARRRLDELRQESFVHEEALAERAQRGVG